MLDRFARAATSVVVILFACGCSGGGPRHEDGGARDTGTVDSATGAHDASPVDAATMDAATMDAAAADAQAASGDAAGLDSEMSDGSPSSCATLVVVGEACSFADDCYQTSAHGCNERCWCPPSGTVHCVYLDSPECSAELCPPSAPIAGSPSTEPPTVVTSFGPDGDGHTLDCTYGTTDCPERCDSYPDSSSLTTYSWRCTTPAGPTCPPSPCPTTLPTGMACTDWGVTCSWAGDLGCRLECGCGSSPFDPATSCYAMGCECPATTPAATDACPPAPYHAACTYGVSTGSGSLLCDCGIHLGSTWSCRDPFAVCPPSVPAGAACTPGEDLTDCPYDAPPYCGRCGCGSDGYWACGPSTCDMCPASAPAHMSSCTADQRGQICQYGMVGPGQVSCACVGTSPIWSCSGGTVP